MDFFMWLIAEKVSFVPIIIVSYFFILLTTARACKKIMNGNYVNYDTGFVIIWAGLGLIYEVLKGNL